MNNETPIAKYHLQVCGKHLEEIFGHGDPSSLFTFIPTRKAIINLMVAILAFIGLIILANYYPTKSWLVLVSLIFLIYYSSIAVKEVFNKKEFKTHFIPFAKQLDDAKTLEFELTNDGLKYSIKDMTCDAKWHEVNVITNIENCICFYKENEETLFLLNLWFESHDFEYLRNVFKEKIPNSPYGPKK